MRYKLSLASLLIGVCFQTVCWQTVGCGPTSENTSDDPEFSEVAPDATTLLIDTDSVTTPLNDANSPSRSVSDPETQPAAIVDGSNGLATQANSALAPFLSEIATLVAGTPTQRTATSRVWRGVVGGQTFRFTITQATTVRYGWKLDVKNTPDADPTFVKILAGRVNKGYTAHRGAGILSLDLTAYQQLLGGTGNAPLTAATGMVYMAFDQVATGSAAYYRVDNFTAGVFAAVPEAYFAAIKILPSTTIPIKRVYIRLGGLAHVLDPVNGVDLGPETVAVRYRRIDGFGGWARAVVSQGNVQPVNTVRVLRYCWLLSPTLDADVLTFRRMWSCPSPYNSTLASHPDCTLDRSFSIPDSSALEPDDPSALASLAPMRKCFETAGIQDPAAAAALGDAAALDPDPSQNIADESTEPVPSTEAVTPPAVSDAVPSQPLKGDGSD